MNLLHKVCLECGCNYSIKNSSREKQNQKFCSKKCFWKNYFKSDRYREVLEKRKLNKKHRKFISLTYYYRNIDKFKDYYNNISKFSLNRVYNSLKDRGRNVSFSIEDLESWLDSKPRVCEYCGIKEDDWIKINCKDRVKRLTIDRKNNDIGYDIDNLALACDTCNKTKNNIFTYEEFKEIAEKYMIPKWKSKILKQENR